MSSVGISPLWILTIVAGYFFMLIFVAWITSRNSTNDDFFINRHKSQWWLVAIGMLGSSLSGVTFISIPGVVGAAGQNQAFSYMQVVLGYLLGYMTISLFLMPMYYRLNLISIYGYLGMRFGKVSYKTGSAFFMLSRLIGSAFRMYLAVMVLHILLCAPFGIPFPVTVVIAIALIWVYTFKGGIRTIVFTDTLQTFCMLAAVILTIYAIMHQLNISLVHLPGAIRDAGYAKVFFFEGGWADENNFFKQFLSGALITIVMTGLDQDMMQKNLSCRNIGEAQKNMFLFSVTLVIANFLVLTLGALLWMYLHHLQLAAPAKSDQLYPLLAMSHLPVYIAIAFIIGLVASAYNSADGTLTALTTTICVDFLGFEKNRAQQGEVLQTKIRRRTHILIAVVFACVILLFQLINKGSVINELFKAAGYTYGPLLGLFSFGLLTKRHLKDSYVLYICIAAPIISYLINTYSQVLFNGLTLGFLILAVNGLLTFIGLWFISGPGGVKGEA
ncbi:MAG: sodium:solute symporter [Saprospiraceae bacterium]|uniref:Sodium:solute symporter n=1 Tax=Candidatus Opimibacter skivensis TaxID=2982028 RepID=A0A9D7XMG3_9BACT|nr:sodium:solute symporter [Candidatus Opimibacter skivensis]